MNTLTKDLFELNEKLAVLEQKLIHTQSSTGNSKLQENNFQSSEEKLNKFFDEKKIILNVGGKKFTCSYSILKQAENSYFSDLINNNNIWQDQEIFIDRDYQHFQTILDFIRQKKLKFKNIKKVEKEEIMKEIDFYNLKEYFKLNCHKKIFLEWDKNLSKVGTFTINEDDPSNIKIHSTTCYTHFVTNMEFNETSFFCELEVNVNQTDDYLYVGIVNEFYNFSSNCMCCNPTNSWYVQCNGTIHSNAINTNDNNFVWRSSKIIIGIKVILSSNSKSVYFYKIGGEEVGPFNLSGDKFRVVCGHCNAGNGEINILNCEEVMES